MNDTTVKSRLVLHFPGIEPLDAGQHYQRFTRECLQFQKVWGLNQQIGPLEPDQGVHGWTTITQKSGEDDEWTVTTRTMLLEYGSHLQLPHPGTFWNKIAACLPRYLAHFLTPAPLKYIKANWRYSLYFFYPLMGMLAIVALTILLVSILNAALTLGLPNSLPLPVLIIAGLPLFVFLFWFLGHRWSFPLVFDVMHYTHKVATRDDQVTLDRIDLFADVLTSKLETVEVDEIAITCHSFGSAFAAASVAKLIRNRPELLENLSLSITAIASNMLKIGLMKECQWLRDDLELVLGHNNIQWSEVYAGDDPLCFHSTAPDTLIKTRPAHSLISRRVRFSKMIAKARYQRIRFRFFRLHRQLILANEFRYFYDFYALLFGPQPIVRALGNRLPTDM